MVLLGHEPIAGLLHPTSCLVSTLQIVCKYTFFIGLVNHTELLNDSTVSADHGSLVLLDNQIIRLAALVALVLLNVSLRLRQLVFCSFLFSLSLDSAFLLNKVLTLLIVEGGHLNFLLIHEAMSLTIFRIRHKVAVASFNPFAFLFFDTFESNLGNFKRLLRALSSLSRPRDTLRFR